MVRLFLNGRAYIQLLLFQIYFYARQAQAWEISDRSKQLQERLKAFMEEHVYPNEARVHQEMNQPHIPWTPSPTLESLKQKAKVRLGASVARAALCHPPADHYAPGSRIVEPLSS